MKAQGDPCTSQSPAQIPHVFFCTLPEFNRTWTYYLHSAKAHGPAREHLLCWSSWVRGSFDPLHLLCRAAAKPPSWITAGWSLPPSTADLKAVQRVQCHTDSQQATFKLHGENIHSRGSDLTFLPIAACQPHRIAEAVFQLPAPLEYFQFFSIQFDETISQHIIMLVLLKNVRHSDSRRLVPEKNYRAVFWKKQTTTEHFKSL